MLCTLFYGENPHERPTIRLFGAGLPLLLFTLPADAASQTSEHRMQQMYVAPLWPGRVTQVAWLGGLTSWEASGGALEKIIDAFATSDEFTKRFGTLSNEQLVANLYQQMFGRAPEQEGLGVVARRAQLASGYSRFCRHSDCRWRARQMTKPHWIMGRSPVKNSPQNWLPLRSNSPEQCGCGKEHDSSGGATTNMEELGVKKSVSLMASSNINMLSAAITPENQQELAVAAARGHQKAIVTETRTGEKTEVQPASTASGIIVEDNFVPPGRWMPGMRTISPTPLVHLP